MIMSRTKLVEASVVDEKFFKFREFFLIGKLVEQEEICNLFVTEPAVLMETGYQIVHFVAPVKKPPVAGNRLPVHHFVARTSENVGQSGENALAV